jgi:hypothetical protein
MFAGRRWLRMAVMSPATTMGDIERLLARIRDLATAADAGARGGAR